MQENKEQPFFIIRSGEEEVTLENRYQNLEVNYHGLFLSPMSWAQVNREMVLAMDRLGCRVSVVANRGFCFRPDFQVPEQITRLRKEPLTSQWDVAFEYPLNYERLRARHKAGLLVYESTRLPAHWSEAICEHLDLLVVPSRFCREAAERSGVPGERIAVVPYGFDPARFHPIQETLPRSKEEGAGFTFLCVAMPHERKGIRELVQAFREEFEPGEEVELLLKMPYRVGDTKSRKPWELEPFEKEGKEALRSPFSDPRIKLFERQDAPHRMPSWYERCDAYVQPSYGEGFGLGILEAKAVGRPTLVTGWGGHLDFCTPENSYLIDYESIPAGKAQYDSEDVEALFAKPSVASLRKQMRRVLQDEEEARSKVDRSLEDIRNLTWNASAGKLLDTLLERM